MCSVDRDEDKISVLIAKFRVQFRGLKEVESDINIEESKMEFKEYMDKRYPIFVAENKKKMLDNFF